VSPVAAVTRGDVPGDWPTQTATIYICYPLDQVPTAGPLLSCIIAACIKTVMRRARRTPTLFALEELPATAQAKLETYIATLGGYGGTLLLYLQTISQLDDVYGKTKAQTILGNCATKLFYLPRDLVTAEHVSKLFGTDLRYGKDPGEMRHAGALTT
jgi:type IV secretory pathway TraG/TraD family ATPase VirD4